MCCFEEASCRPVWHHLFGLSFPYQLAVPSPTFFSPFSSSFCSCFRRPRVCSARSSSLLFSSLLLFFLVSPCSGFLPHFFSLSLGGGEALSPHFGFVCARVVLDSRLEQVGYQRAAKPFPSDLPSSQPPRCLEENFSVTDLPPWCVFFISHPR